MFLIFNNQRIGLQGYRNNGYGKQTRHHPSVDNGANLDHKTFVHRSDAFAIKGVFRCHDFHIAKEKDVDNQNNDRNHQGVHHANMVGENHLQMALC